MNQYIFGHRGASAYAPENTLEAFKLAADMGAHGVELDVHICKSGELVVAHDETVDRVSDGHGLIKDMTLSELKALHFNKTHPEYKDARLPTLQEVFQLLRPTGLRINVELKNSAIDYPELEKRVIELAVQENMAIMPRDWIAQPSSIRGRILPQRVLTRSYRKASSGSVIASKMRVKVSRPPMISVEMPKPMLAA